MPLPPLPCSSVSACPLHGKGKRAPPILVNTEPQTLASTASTFPQPPEQGNLPFATPTSVEHWPTADSSPYIHSAPFNSCHFLPTLTVTANLQQKCHAKPLRSCKSTAWDITSHTRGKRASPDHPLQVILDPAASHPPPGSNGSNSAQRGRHSCAPVTSLATGRATVRAASLVIPRIQMLHAHKHALVLGHVTALPRPRAASAPQGIQLSQREPWGCWSQPDLCACSRKLVADTGSHRNSLLPAKPRLSPAEATPSQGRSAWAHPPHSSELCAGPPGQEQGQRCREESPLQALGGLLGQQ